MKPDSTDTAAAARDTPPPAPFGPGQDEFPDGAGEFTDEPSRRRFLSLMGASMALAGAAGCNLRPAPQRKIVPYTTQPDEITPGVPLFFATAAPMAGGYGLGVLARSSEGRPTKIEGNPDHPASLGGASIHALASVLGLYDPDRSRTPTHRGIPAAYEEAVAALRAKLFTGTAPNAGVRLRVVTEAVTSPTQAGQLRRLLASFPNAKWVQYEAAGGENARAGAAKAFGKPVAVTYDFLKADVVVSLEADVLCVGPGHVRYARDFADRRKIRLDGKDAAELAAGRKPKAVFKDGVKDAHVNRLYAVECMPTNTGAVADHRLALTTAQIGAFARALAAALGVAGATAAGELPKAAQEWVKPLADDLLAKKGKSVVAAGDHLPAWVHTVVHAINAHLGNLGQTVKLSAPVEARADEKRMSGLKELTGEMAAKQVDVLVFLGGDTNPAYTAPVDVPFVEELKKVPFTFHLGSHQDETGVLCEWHVNEAHYLETWGDVRSYDGTATIQQPLIAPLHGGHSAIELLAALMKTSEPTVPGSPHDPLDIVRATWQNAAEVKKTFPGYQAPAVFEQFWQETVRSGVVPGTAAAADGAAALAGNWAADMPAPAAAPAKGTYELNFRADPTLFDGRFASNGWLQEVSKPLTKISWDNAAFVGANTAKALDTTTDFRWTAGEHGRAEVSVIEIEVAGKKVKLPAWHLPGHAEDAITVHLGHGRGRAGAHTATTPDEPNAEGKPVRGTDVYPLRFAATPWAVPAKAAKAGSTYFLACTQGYWSMLEKDPVSGKQLDRKPVRRGTLEHFRTTPKFAKIPPMAAGETELINENVPLPRGSEALNVEEHGHGAHARLHPLNMYNPAEGLSPDLREAQRRRWAMAIDLSACTGCSACVVACQSENNTPVVGKEQVTRGREMYWISIDRYYEGTQRDPDAAQTYFQPRMCVQCENAPCEVVCPVGATVHSVDGLNDMTYNRCVGTRYCSNNCPYKVRRFNFLTFQDWDTDTLKLGRNPDVSVRSRGVMEKCTFCVQRIRGAEIVAEREFRPVRDGEILTACQSACPSGAIVFGDINDPDATVSKWKNEPTNFGLLAELNTRPRLTHLAVVRNPNPAMPK